jgi:hypothetical protein
MIIEERIMPERPDRAAAGMGVVADSLVTRSR